MKLWVNDNTAITFMHGKPIKIEWMPDIMVPLNHLNWLVESGDQYLMGCGFDERIQEIHKSGMEPHQVTVVATVG